MNGDPAPKRATLGPAAMDLMLAAGLRRSQAAARVDPDLIGKSSLETPTVLTVFVETHPELAGEFMRRAGIDPGALDHALRLSRAPEPPPDPPRLPEHPTEEQRESFEFFRERDEERRAKGEAAPFSGPVKRAQRAAGAEAASAGESRTPLGCYVAVLAETESNARTAVREVADPSRLAEALAWLRAQPDPPEKDQSIRSDEMRKRFRETAAAAYAGVRAKQEAAMTAEARRQRDEVYERNPARYEAPVDVAAELAAEPPIPKQAYLWRTGVCRRAAENEARMRRAPEATLDHLLVALLRDGTDTAALLDARGVDRADLSRRLDEALPRFAEGPRWPPLDRALGMGLPDDKSLRLKKPLPEGVRFGDLTDEQRREHVEVFRDESRRFTDLVFAEKIPNEPDTVGHGLLAEAGITGDALKAERVAREKGDPDWWRRPPDLLASLEEAERTSPMPELARAQAYKESARHHARMRRAPQVEIDDLLLAILVPGTDLWALVESVGQAPVALREEAEGLPPRFEAGPMFPDDEPVGMRLLTSAKRGHSDLLFLRPEPWDKAESPVLNLLRSRGVTPEIVDARLAELGIVPLI